MNPINVLYLFPNTLDFNTSQEFFCFRLMQCLIYSTVLRFYSLCTCGAAGGENQALPPPEGEARVHPAVGPGGAAVLCV